MRNKFFKNKILPVLLSLFMIISMFSVSANAENINADIEESADYVVTPMSINPGDVCAIGETGYATLEAALSAVQSGETIRLLKDINKTFTNTIKIDKNITFDLTDGNLTIFKSAGLALEVKNCTVSLIGEGYMDVTGGVGIEANNAIVTVRNVTGNQGKGAYAIDGGKITVLGDAKGRSEAACAFGNNSVITVEGDSISTGNDTLAVGAKAEQLGTVNVKGDAKGYSYGVYAYNYSVVTVESDVTATGSDGIGAIGAYASNNSQITIDGSLNGEIFVQVDGTRKEASEKTTPSTKVGYDTYHETTSTIWVKETEPSPTKLDTPVNLLWDDSTPGTIKAKWDAVPHAGKYYVYLYMAGYPHCILETLEPKNERDFAVNFKSYGDAIYTFKVEARPATGDSSYTTSDISVASPPYTYTAPVCEINGVAYATLTDALASVQNNSTVTVKLLKDFTHQGRIVIYNGQNKKITFDLNSFTLDIISNEGSGIYITEGSSIDYIDNSSYPGSFNVTGREAGVWAEHDSSVKVSNAIATAASINNDAQSYGAYARYGAQITVTQNATGNKYGAYADSGYGGRRSKVIVGGNAVSENVDNPFNPRAGAIATNYADIVVDGNASGGRIGVYSGSSSTAKVDGNAIGGMYGAYAELNSTTEVLGDVVATSQYGYAAYNLNTDSSVTVKGNAIAAANGVGAVANIGNITIDGVITAEIYVRTGSVDKNFDEYIIDSVKPGYLKYTNDEGTAVVWVKGSSGAVLPTVLTGAVTNVTSNGAILSGSVTSDGGAAVTEIGYVYSTMPNPVVDGLGVTKIILGSSYNGPFEMSISGLSAETKYYVRAYAKNSVGVSYGSDVSFTTLTANVPSNPPVSSGGDTSQMPVITVDKEGNHPAIASMKSNAGLNDNGNATVMIKEQDVKALIEAAKKYAENKDKIEDGIGIAFYIQFASQGRSLSVDMEEKALILLEKEDVELFNVNSLLVKLSFDKGAIQKMKSQSSGKLTMSVLPFTKLSAEAKLLIGRRPVYDLTISYNKKGNTEYITDFGQGTATLSIAYKADSGENSNNLFAVYVDKNGKPQLLKNSFYDNGWLTFGRNSLSVYGVAYKKTVPVFNDIIGHWAEKDINFIAALDLILGTGETIFSPNKAITRAEFIMALGKLSGEDMSSYMLSSFADVPDTSSHLPYIEWAVKKGIIQGIGGNKFGPEMQITREQMAVMMVNYVKAVGYELPVLQQILSFADDEEISLWAKDSVKTIQQAGIIIGKNNNLFDPAGNATRAETSIILRRFMELIIE